MSNGDMNEWMKEKKMELNENILSTFHFLNNNF